MAKVYQFKANSDKKRIRIRHVLITLLALYIAFILVTQQIAINKAKAEKARIQAEIEKLAEENKKIQLQLEDMQSDEYIEKIARERLGLIKPGEYMFVDVNNNRRTTGD